MNQGGVRTEKVWFNFSPDRVSWARYAGKNQTDRQRIKRKAENRAERYRALPSGERMAVLAAVMAVETSEYSAASDTSVDGTTSARYCTADKPAQRAFL